jgi:hypothetical protein
MGAILRFFRQSLVILLILAGVAGGIYLIVSYASGQGHAPGISGHPDIKTHHASRRADVTPGGEYENVQASSRGHHSREGLSARGIVGVLRTCLIIASIT